MQHLSELKNWEVSKFNNPESTKIYCQNVDCAPRKFWNGNPRQWQFPCRFSSSEKFQFLNENRNDNRFSLTQRWGYVLQFSYGTYSKFWGFLLSQNRKIVTIHPSHVPRIPEIVTLDKSCRIFLIITKDTSKFSGFCLLFPYFSFSFNEKYSFFGPINQKKRKKLQLMYFLMRLERDEDAGGGDFISLEFSKIKILHHTATKNRCY